jgi:hypothetical protein
MKDTQLYEQLLGLSKPWSVDRVELELEQSRITVHVECVQGTVWGDPETEQDRAHIHGWVERSWRHLDILPACGSLDGCFSRGPSALSSTDAASDAAAQEAVLA